MQEIDLAQFVLLEEPTLLQLAMQSARGEDKIQVNIVVLFTPIKAQLGTSSSAILNAVSTPKN